MEKKREYNKYSILQIRKMEEHLEQMAEKGWMLEKAGSLIWTYHKIEAKQMHFSIVFFPKTSALDPEPSENLKMMWEFCEQTGWKLAAQLGQMQIFYNEAEHPVPIETEAWIQVKNIHETAKSSVIFTYGILLFNSILQIGTQTMQFALEPIDWLAFGYNVFLLLVWIAFGIGCSVELIYYYAWYRKAKRIAEEEEVLFLPKPIHGFRVVYLGIAFLSLAFAILSIADVLSGKYGLLVILWTTAIIGGVYFISRILKAFKVSARKNMIITCILGVLVSVIMGVHIFSSIAADAELLFEKKAEMPIQLSDIREVSTDDLVGNLRAGNSIFISYIDATEFEDLEEGEEEEEFLSIDYKMIDINTPFVYDFCKKELLTQDNYLSESDENYWDAYKKVEMPVWEAQEVYRRYTGGEMRNDFILCYENILLEISFGWDVTDEDIAKVREIVKTKN